MKAEKFKDIEARFLIAYQSGAKNGESMYDYAMRFGNPEAVGHRHDAFSWLKEKYGLGRRLMAVEGYVPAMGMVNSDGEMVYFVDKDRVLTDGLSYTVNTFVSDLSRGATRGELLEQLRDMLDAPDLGLVYISDFSRWFVTRSDRHGSFGSGHSIGSALVDAVERWARNGTE